MAAIPPGSWREAKIGRSEVPLISFHIVEWQFPRRVMRQFGFRQPIVRDPPRDLESYRRFSLQGNYDVDFAAKYANEIDCWEREKRRRVKGDVIYNDMFFGVSIEYRTWFETAGLPKIFPSEEYPVIWRPAAGRRDRATKDYNKRMRIEASWLNSPIIEYRDVDYPFQFGVDAVSEDEGDGQTSHVPVLRQSGAYIPG